MRRSMDELEGNSEEMQRRTNAGAQSDNSMFESGQESRPKVPPRSTSPHFLGPVWLEPGIRTLIL
jgi:hypothetical protein